MATTELTYQRVQDLRLHDNILGHIGNTPLVKLNRIPAEYGVSCSVYAKCEFFNSGGSIKDRIALAMVEDAEIKGIITPGTSVLIEPTSGNTGIGLALCGAVKGYRTIIVMPEKMSMEKVAVLRALGAEIVRTPTSAAWDSPDSHMSVAKRLEAEIPNGIILDQYKNPQNPGMHYVSTAEEIFQQMDGKIDMVVVGAGTGGTITGVARKLKEKLPDIKIVGVDPEGSILAQPEEMNETAVTGYEVEGIGYDFIPDALDRTLVDIWMKSKDKESLTMARQLIKDEGLLCGGSGGSAVSCAMIAAKELDKDQRVVVILADSIRNYMTKHLSDQWMADRKFMVLPEDEVSEHWWSLNRVAVLERPPLLTVTPSITCQDAVALMQSKGYDQLPVVDPQSVIVGMVTLGALMAKLMSGKVSPSSSVKEILYSQFQRITLDTNLGCLSQILQKDHFAVIVHTNRLYVEGKVEEKEICVGIVTQIDLLTFITKQKCALTPASPMANGIPE